MRTNEQAMSSGLISARSRLHQAHLAFLIAVFLLPGSCLFERTAWGGNLPVTWDKRGILHVPSAVGAKLVTDLGDDRLVTAGLGVRTKHVSSFILRSYDAQTGALITEDEFDLMVDEESAAAIDAGGGRIYAVGSGLNAEGGLSLLVRAYDARTGELLWEDELNPAAGDDAKTATFRSDVRKHDATLVSDPVVTPVAQSLYLVQASDDETGEVRWQDEFLTNAAREDGEGEGHALRQLAVAGLSFSILVRTYETETGNLLWHDRFNPAELTSAPPDDEADFDARGEDEEESSERHLIRHRTTESARPAAFGSL